MTRRSVKALEWMFSRYNARYFGGRLPEYQIRLARIITIGDRSIYRGACNYNDMEIYILSSICTTDGCGCDGMTRSQDHHLMVCAGPACPLPILIHEMIHVAVGHKAGHGRAFKAEARRLRDLGAPVYEKDLGARP